MVIKRPVDIKSSEITDQALYRQRRVFIQSSIGLALAATLGHTLARTVSPERQLKYKKSVITLRDELTPYEDITTYNNFYEFGTDKSDPAKYAQQLTTSPWNFSVEGECEKPGTYHLEDILSKVALEERIYRLRCVERWSMVVPWIGFPLSDLIKRFAPTSRAKYVEFRTLHRPEEMPGQMRRVLDWPYVEGLRMDEAMHPLTIIAVGLYGEVMPNQNGAPMRLVVPWKYGFKSIKSIASIRFTEQEPVSSWTRAAAHEYGFYSNVNPNVDHPRWSQKKERRIGEFLKRDTLMFNGYGEQVASLYAGMDLKKYY